VNAKLDEYELRARRAGRKADRNAHDAISCDPAKKPTGSITRVVLANDRPEFDMWLIPAAAYECRTVC
jgi:hypothetical protein